MSAARAEVESGGIEAVGRERVAQHGEIAVAIRKSLAERLPRFAGVTRAPYFDRAFERHAKGVGLERDQVRGIAAARMRDQRKAELRRQSIVDVDPRIAAVVAAIDAGMVLEINARGIFRIVAHLMRALRTEMARVRRTAFHLHALV